MNDNEATLDTVFRIFPAHGEGAYLEVSINGEEMVCVQTKDKISETYFGKVDFSVEKETAKKLAEAMRALT